MLGIAAVSKIVGVDAIVTDFDGSVNRFGGFGGFVVILQGGRECKMGRICYGDRVDKMGRGVGIGRARKKRKVV